MTVSRRKFITLIGGGVVLAAAAGSAGFVATRRPNIALAPWERAGNYSDPRMAALSWAILAPNPHNRQPWQAELTGTDGVRIWREAARNLPETDPFDRQMTIGMGCFLELFRQAAAEQGFRAEMGLFPEGEQGPVAEIKLVSGGQPDPLFQHVPSRHTNRLAYEDRVPEDAALAKLAPEASEIITDKNRVSDLRALTWDAMFIEMNTHRTHMESVNLTRLGKREINANPDGISISGAMLEALILAGMLTREGQSDPESAEFAQTADFIRSALEATPAYVTVNTAGNSRLDQIEAGRRWVRLNLATTSAGIAMQPLSQALQEYDEQSELYAKVHEMLAAPGETVQMLGRIGYAAPIGPSPRWPLESRMIGA
jgi:hypothetical protein